MVNVASAASSPEPSLDAEMVNVASASTASDSKTVAMSSHGLTAWMLLVLVLLRRS